MMGQSRLQKKPGFAPGILLVLFCGLLAFESQAGRAAPDAGIRHLLDYVAASDQVFIRNGERYSGEQAAQHMQKKYAHYRSRIKTPEDFIELCASRSLLSGKPYRLINAQGEEITTADWLTDELQAYRKRQDDEGAQ